MRVHQLGVTERIVRKVRVTNGMQELRTEEDSLELRQVGSW